MEYIHTFPGYEIMISHITDGDMRNPKSFGDILRPYPQDHGTIIAEYTGEGTVELAHLDGIYTQIGGVTIGALCADCPVLIFMGNGEIAVIHSGWRGTKDHIVRNAIKLLRNTQLSKIQVYIGPHIQRESYEVQSDFFEHFPRSYILKRKDKWYFDIETYLVDDLLALGIEKTNIYSHGGDTFRDTKYFSYRRDGMIGVGCVSVKMDAPLIS